ncbi:MAG: hypothetical protein KAJ62_06055 [Desulfobacteraceae bacterium]|nr:hypothetical protein [Desulfobacteraceae bacterium]
MFNFSFIDIDERIESDRNCSIASIVDTSGWEEFRKLEKQALFQLNYKKNLIVSTGGGIVLDIENRKFLKYQNNVIWLFAQKNVILKRLKKDNKTLISRPSLTNIDLEKETEMLIKQREQFYSEITQIKFNTSFKTPEELAHMIKRRILNDRE